MSPQVAIVVAVYVTPYISIYLLINTDKLILLPCVQNRSKNSLVVDLLLATTQTTPPIPVLDFPNTYPGNTGPFGTETAKTGWFPPKDCYINTAMPAYRFPIFQPAHASQTTLPTFTSRPTSERDTEKHQFFDGESLVALLESSLSLHFTVGMTQQHAKSSTFSS